MIKVKARALFYAVIVSVFVAIISSALLLSSYHQHLLMGHYSNQKRLLHNCESGVQLLLGAQRTQIPSTVIDLYNNGTDSIRVAQQPWGLLEVAFVESWVLNTVLPDTVKRSFFIGTSAPDYALKLSEGTDALALCGNTKIVGDVFVPKEGVERGFIHGKPFQGERLVDGKINIIKNTSNTFLKERFDQLAALEQNAVASPLESDSLTQSFGKPTKVLRSRNFNTAGLFLKGNVLIIADSLLTIAANSQLEDVILIGKTVQIESGFQGAIQVFAKDHLVVESDGLLDYPSVLSLLPKAKSMDFSPHIELQDGCNQTGAIVVPMFQYNEHQPIVHIHPKAIVNGQVWVNGLLQLDGSIYGSIFCDAFLLKTAAAVYENYLLDAVIDRSGLSPYYLAPPLLGNGNKRGILKFLE